MGGDIMTDDRTKSSLNVDFEADYANGNIEAVNRFFKKEYVLKFKGIDDFNRPVFKKEGVHEFYGDLYNLFSYSESAEDVLSFYKINPKELSNLCYFGRSFNCEPEGGYLQDATYILTI